MTGSPVLKVISNKSSEELYLAEYRTPYTKIVIARYRCFRFFSCRIPMKESRHFL